MPDNVRHDHAEAHFRALLEGSGLPQPDVLLDLDELAPGDDPFAGFDAGELFADHGFAQAG